MLGKDALRWLLVRIRGVGTVHMQRPLIRHGDHVLRLLLVLATPLPPVALHAQESARVFARMPAPPTDDRAYFAARVGDTLSEATQADDARYAFVKVNASTLLGIPGVAYEVELSDRTSFNLDATASLWGSVNGAPFLFFTVIPEWQVHSRSGRVGWYAGAHLGASIYRLQKWNYWGTRLYQEGYSTLLGGTIGYKRLLPSKLLLDIYIGGGSQHGRYRGFDGATGVQYAGTERLDESREWLPYRVGLMLGYRIR